jgi:iron complex transport system substrate-binding protein
MALVRRLLFAALALALVPGAATAAPQRIMSANGCTDLLLLQLVPRSRIASVTYRAKDAVRGIAPGAADGVATNDGRPEEVVRDRPDLLVAGRFTTARTKAFARRAGVPVLELDDAANFDDVRRNIRALGEAVGEPVRAEALVARMDRALASLDRGRPDRPRAVAAWSGGGIVLGRDTLADAIIRAAGAANVAAGQPALAFGDFDLEMLLRARPDALLQTDPRYTEPTLQREHGRHRLVRRLYRDRVVILPEGVINCGLPQSAEAAVALRRSLAAIPPLEPIR